MYDAGRRARRSNDLTRERSENRITRTSQRISKIGVSTGEGSTGLLQDGTRGTAECPAQLSDVQAGMGDLMAVVRHQAALFENLFS